MHNLTDQQLLCDYVAHQSEAAFSELVRRHVDLVYSAARRLVRDPHLTEDVTQGAFVALARNARHLTNRPVLSGWLHGTARNLAAKTVRSDVRRRAREQEAAAMNELLATEPEANWELIAPHLDDALGELNEADRDALLLRYFENKSAREMAQTLSISDEAAQKRVSRAMERLRGFFAKRGITIGASGLAVVISANAVQAAPVGLALTISTAAVLTGTTLATSSTVSATKAIAMTALQKTIVTATVVVLAGAGIYEARQASQLRDQVQTLRQQVTPPPSSNDEALFALQQKTDMLAAQNADLTNALTRVNLEKARLEMEREQAKRAAALYKELGDQASSQDTNPTNEYPSPRYVWAAFGRMGRLSALSKEADSQYSPEEKSALEAAKAKALESLPNLVKTAKYYEEAKPTSSEAPTKDQSDLWACLLYGALDLDEQQFGQVYSLAQKVQEEAKQPSLSGTNPAPEKAAALKQMIEQFKVESRPLLTPEQTRVLADVLTHVKVESTTFGFNFSF